jgi:hypothetical protein
VAVGFNLLLSPPKPPAPLGLCFMILSSYLDHSFPVLDIQCRLKPVLLTNRYRRPTTIPGSLGTEKTGASRFKEATKASSLFFDGIRSDILRML